MATARRGGLGLGLAVVKSLVALHQGTVSAASEGAGHGSEFVVRVPWLDAAAPVTRPLPGAEARPAQPELRQTVKRILLVDDNQDASETLADVLRELGHEVEVAADGPTALRQLRAFAAEVAILDLGLPVMDGFELARRVCEERTGARPRLIALTGYGRERDFAKSRAVGFDVHLVKPVDLPALVAALEPGGAGRAPAE